MATIRITGLCALEWTGSANAGTQRGNLLVHLLKAEGHRAVLLARAGDLADPSKTEQWSYTIVPPDSIDPADVILVWDLNGISGNAGSGNVHEKAADSVEMIFRDHTDESDCDDWHLASGFADLVQAADAAPGMNGNVSKWGCVTLNNGFVGPAGTQSPFYLFTPTGTPCAEVPESCKGPYTFASQAMYVWIPPTGQSAFTFPHPNPRAGASGILFKPTARLMICNQPCKPITITLAQIATVEGMSYSPISHFGCLRGAVQGGQAQNDLWAGILPGGAIEIKGSAESRKVHPLMATDPDHCVVGFVRQTQGE